MDKTIGALRQLFERLYREQQGSWFPQGRGRKASAQAQKAWEEHLINLWYPMGEEDFEYWFPTSSYELHVDFSRRDRFLYLPPLEKDAEFVPILSMKCDLDDTRAEMKLQVMLVRLVGRRLCGIGFRLESRRGDEEEEEGDTEMDEEEEREGRHDFYHAQLIRDFDGGPPIECPEWLPCTQPSFPVTADCPVTLVLCLLLSLYGKRCSWDFVSRDTGLFHFLKPYVKDKLQSWVQWKALATYT